eukprot:m.310717 g.310717  ORF g.310717 m.310717 type:complete len:351 (+) comp54070_c0_seq1:110-1162(+)
MLIFYLTVIFTIKSAFAGYSSGCKIEFDLSQLDDNKCTAKTIATSYGKRNYQLCLPSGYDDHKAWPLIVNYHGWSGTAEGDIYNAGFEAFGVPAITVHPQGYADHPGSSWGSWHVNGTAESPGPQGPTCTVQGGHDNYCYESCRRRPQGCDARGCDWTTCVDDYAFAEQLYDEVESVVCVNTSREYASGCSNGGMMAYGLGARMSNRLAAIAPVCGSFSMGFLEAPDSEYGMPVIDIHGTQDTTVPANLTSYNKVGDQYPLSSDGWYYTQVSDIFKEWKERNGCTGDDFQYKTSLVGEEGLYCIAEGQCTKGDVVRCAWNGGHDYYGGSGSTYNAQLVWEFLSKFSRKRS